MSEPRTILFLLAGVYVFTMAVFLISENRRPQATIAWLLVLYVAPGLGLLIYVLFGRDRKSFSKQTKLLMQSLEPHARPILSPLISQQDREIARLENESPSHRKLMKLVRRNSPSALTRHNRVEILQDASTFYPRMLEDMKSARHSIHLQYFIWRGDECGARFSEVLAAKAKDGVEVRLLYDPLGSSKSVNRAYVRKMEQAGIHMAPTSPLYRLHTISYRNHRKITVIDGRIGYTGGMNIGQEHLDGGEGFTSWRDTQVRIEGQGAAVLQAVFGVDWYNAVKEEVFSPKNFPDEAIASSEGATPMQILTSGPDSQWEAIRQLYSFMVATAERYVCLQSPYFVLDASLAEALRTAALSGVDVKVMLSARASGNPLPEWAGNTYIADIVKSGVRVFLYEKGYLHAKTISIDSKICSIGSANIDIRSFSINYELNAVLYEERLAKELERAFAEDLRHCTEFDAEQYRQRSRLVRFRDSLARLLSPLL